MKADFWGELVGTAILILLGNGVVACVVLRRSYGHAGGWGVITAGWAFAVMAGVFAALAIGSNAHLNPVGCLVWGIGLSLGGTTGYAINPARDFGPRMMHALLPISGKGQSHWDYAGIPIIGPLVGACLAGLVVRLLAM